MNDLRLAMAIYRDKDVQENVKFLSNASEHYNFDLSLNGTTVQLNRINCDNGNKATENFDMQRLNFKRNLGAGRIEDIDYYVWFLDAMVTATITNKCKIDLHKEPDAHFITLIMMSVIADGVPLDDAFRRGLEY